MSAPPAIEAALKRLGSALDLLHAAAERQARAEAARGDAREEFAILRDDRSRLGVELDGALTRLRRVEQAQEEAMRRLDRASQTIRAALGETDDDDDASADELAAADDPEDAA